MEPILAGLETEYGLLVEGRGAEDQIDDSMALVRSYPGERFVGWDYRWESPRQDLRGFKLDHLAVDPEDAKFDRVARRTTQDDVRMDRVLPNGARLYNDHGHPEWSTPECHSLHELVLQDLAGELAVRRAARAFEAESEREVKLYKNNTDYHGASYGTHESYLCPRFLGFDRLYAAVTPILVARQILTGAGKTGAESGGSVDFQISQRADFFSEPANAETLFRRPIFNTRDEPHADPADWIRLHVISGDANMIPAATARKVGLVKLAIALEKIGEAPRWRLSQPVRAFQDTSRDLKLDARIDLEGGSWTTARLILESYLDATERVFGLQIPADPGPFPRLYGSVHEEMAALIASCRALLAAWDSGAPQFVASVDWAAKRAMLEQVRESEGWPWSEPSLRSYDLEYHNIEPDDGLYFALADMGEVESRPPAEEVHARLRESFEPTRARARGLAVRNFSGSLVSASWRTLTLRQENGRDETVELHVDRTYTEDPSAVSSVQSFTEWLRGR